MKGEKGNTILDYLTEMVKTLQREQEKREQSNKKGKKRLFTEKEDQILMLLVSLFGDKNWGEVAEFIPGKTKRQCRERYKIYLAPGINHGNWRQCDDERLNALYCQIGPRWSLLTRFFPGRTANFLKNRYNVHINPLYRDRKNKNKQNSSTSEVIPTENLDQQNKNDSNVFVFEPMDNSIQELSDLSCGFTKFDVEDFPEIPLPFAALHDIAADF